MKFKCNCCDGIYNSFDVHFTDACDNKCKHCIDIKYKGIGITKPDINKITNTIIKNKEGYDDVLFLGGEPCLYLNELLKAVKILRNETDLKLFVTTAVPKICYDKKDIFYKLIEELDGINLSVQHYNEEIADKIRNTKSLYDRQSFYASLPYKKDKIRINLNIVKPYLYTKEDITNCLLHYDKLNFNSIKLSEIQHGKEYFISFEKVFNIKLGSAYSEGCQTYLDIKNIIPELSTKLLLKRSCFLCEETLDANIKDGIKVLSKLFVKSNKNKYGVVYEDGTLSKGWK